MNPNENNVPNNSNNSAILSIDSSSQIIPNISHIDGHNILNQVQLEFISSVDDENVFFTDRNKQMDLFENQSERLNRFDQLNNEMNNGNENFVSENIQQIDQLESSKHSADESSNKSIWKIEYYSRYFDLTTKIFFQKILWSILPLNVGDKGTYIDRFIHLNADLYGPIWISLTLIFTLSICGDIIHHLNLSPHIPPNSNLTTTIVKNPEYHQKNLKFEFERLRSITTITFAYVLLTPLILWSFCQWRRCNKIYSFVECLCAYGYSLSFFIPASILALINILQIQFILFASAAFLSGLVLMISFAPVVHSDPNKSFKFAYILLVLILVLHLILALFYLYVFV
ncbi:Protein YIPF1 [Sarcoptes scabiei]|uniref:Protein YIPF n=1 Tax=Sarcoptes scabiei TaxID=52283 RepID=A0A834RGE2_SARSC|nr:Protein YIPF1 [Sarcoptes scabiei]